MQLMTEEEAIRWCSNWPNKLRLDMDQLKFIDPSKEIKLDVPAAGNKTVVLARNLSLFSLEDEAAFTGAMLWLRRWDQWSSVIDKVGWKTYERMRAGYGELRSLESAPIILFRLDELVDFIAFFSQVLIYQWDAYSIFKGEQYFVEANHDGIIRLVTPNEELLNKALNGLEQWHPQRI